jgi:hypothetical protein
LTNGSSSLRSVSAQNHTFQLNTTTLRAFFLHGNNFVYAIDQLPLDSSTDPCTQRTRWRALGGPCVASTSLDGATRAALASAINASTDINTFVKDVQVT